MAEPTPTSNDKTANLSDCNPTLQDSSDSTNGEGGCVILLLPPFQASSIQRRAADVMRRKLRWSEGSPPGIYWNGDDNPYEPFVLKGTSQGSQDGTGAPDNAAGSSGLQATALTSIVTQGFRLTSDDSSDSGSSAPGPLTPTSSDSSTPPQTPFKTSRFSGTARRRGTGDSQDDSEDDVQGQLIELLPESMHLVKRQCYALELTILKDASNGIRKETVIKLNIDTGSNNTWILGDEHCEVTVLELRPETRIPTKVHLTKWPLNKPPPKHGTLKPNPFARHPGDLGIILQEPYLPPKIAYTDKSLVLVEQLAEPLAFKVKNFYNWHQSRRNVPLTFGYRFAVAFAVDESIIHDPVDGIVGLGPLRRQRVFKSKVAAKDFSTVLTEQCVPLKGETEEDTYNGGHLYCFALRPAWVDKIIDPSWLSINQIPGSDDMDFSNKIPVQQRLSRQDRPILDWSVEMQSMTFFQLVWEPSDGGIPQRRRVLLGEVDFTDPKYGKREQDNGVLFKLDTGASTTDLPPAAFDHIRTNIFSSEDVTTDGQQEFLLKIPSAYCSDDSVVVDFVFRGENDALVTVTGPAMPFLCQNLDGEGLLFAYDYSDGYVLGANFFQTMFVAMHRPENSVRCGPYVRLAPQWPQEMYRLRLPPKEDDDLMEVSDGAELMEVEGESQ